jgi:hypothetical protein
MKYEIEGSRFMKNPQENHETEEFRGGDRFMDWPREWARMEFPRIS